ncbi:MAG: four helix bundle protein [Selenomonadaceae bacterium]|nr:four helix bundle protein [Selenomonadaceae bacterium]
MNLAVEICRLVKLLPKSEIYALSDQMRRVAVSIPSNIAEGQGRNSTKEYVKFLSFARGSQTELETQLEICLRLEYLSVSDAEVALGLCQEISKMLVTMMKKLTDEDKSL